MPPLDNPPATSPAADGELPRRRPLAALPAPALAQTTGKTALTRVEFPPKAITAAPAPVATAPAELNAAPAPPRPAQLSRLKPPGACPSGHGPGWTCGYCTEMAALEAPAPPPGTVAAVLDILAEAAELVGGEPAGISLGAALHTVTVQVRTLAEFTAWAGRLATTHTVHGGDAFGKWSRAHADVLGWDTHVMLIGGSE